MKSQRRQALVALTALGALTLTACHKKPAEPPAASESVAPAPAPQAQAAAPSPEQDELETKKKALAEALAENDIVNDPKGQWAVDASASSASGDAKDQDGYAPWQVTGRPNVEHFGVSTDAWISKQADAGIEWLKVDFATPVHATGLRVRQTNAPGAIVQIELLDTDGGSHVVWHGVDDSHYEDDHIAWLQKNFEPTPYQVKGAKITLATNMVQGYNAIDAIQLIGQ